jgi:hypothetical protein
MSRVLEAIGLIVIVGTVLATFGSLVGIGGMPPFLLDLAALGVIAAVALLAVLTAPRG